MQNYHLWQQFIDDFQLPIPSLDDLKQKCLDDKVPIIDPAVENLLGLLLNIHKPKNILELGTAYGYSAAYMAHIVGDRVNITSVELDLERYQIARQYIDILQLLNVELICQDALLYLANIKITYDFIFIDAAKSRYLDYFLLAAQQLNKNGLIVLDNIWQLGFLSGKIVTKTNRYKTIRKKMRNFIDYLSKSTDFKVSFLPISDGVAVCIKL